jgi:hypothetical protein
MPLAGISDHEPTGSMSRGESTGCPMIPNDSFDARWILS